MVLSFAVSESGTHALANCMAKAEQMFIVYEERWQSQLFFPILGTKKYASTAKPSIKYPHTRVICRGHCFRSELCIAVWFICLCLRSTSTSWLARAMAFKGTLADRLLLELGQLDSLKVVPD